jgi:antitoxin ParD1/3/4
MPCWPTCESGDQVMEISLPPEQQSFIEDLVQAGRFSSTDEAISECVRRLMTEEQLKKLVDVGIEQADRGNVMDHDTVFANLKTRAAELHESNGGQ